MNNQNKTQIKKSQIFEKKLKFRHIFSYLLNISHWIIFLKPDLIKTFNG